MSGPDTTVATAAERLREGDNIADLRRDNVKRDVIHAAVRRINEERSASVSVEEATDRIEDGEEFVSLLLAGVEKDTVMKALVMADT